MDFTDALYRGITNGRSRATEGRSVPGMVAELARALGTKPPAGLSPRTWQRLRNDPSKGTTPRTRSLLALAQRRARLAAKREARLRRPHPTIEITADVRISNTVQYSRTLHVGKWIDADGYHGPMVRGVLGRTLDHWLRGDDLGAEGEMLAAIEAHLAAHGASGGLELDNVERVYLA